MRRRIRSCSAPSTASTSRSQQLLTDQPTIAIGIIGQEIIVGDVPLPRAAESMGEMIRRLKSLGIERIAFDRGVTPEELQTLALTIAHPERRPGQSAPGVEPADPLGVLNGLPHIRVGRIQTEEKKETSAADIATIRRLYSDATNVASSVWEIAKTEGTPDPKAARALVDSLAQAVSANRTALIALTALKNYDNYTFTHMVNVSILTMSQARALGIEGTTLRELGLAALMHDIGKVRTPTEILNKPDKLTDGEFDGDAHARRRRRRDPAPHAGDARGRAGHRLRASLASRWHRLPVRRVAHGAQPRHACCAASPTSTTRCDRSARISRRSRPTASSKS